MGHENQLGAQQANAFGALLHRCVNTGALTDVGEHFNRMTVCGQRRLMALFGGSLQTLFAGIALFGGALQGCRVGVHMQATALAIQQQRRARRQQQHSRTGADQRRNAEGTGDDGAVGRGAATGGENAGHASGIKTCHIGRADFIHHQNVRLIRFARSFDATKLRQHPSADITQIGGALGEQRILQRFLLLGRRFNHRHPRCFGALTLFETGVDFIGQFRVVEHFLMGDENLANGLGLAAFDQALNVVAHRCQRLLETLALNRSGLTAQRVFDGLQDLNMRRADGDSRCGSDRLHKTAGRRRQQHFGYLDDFFTRLTHRWQRLDFFAQAFFDSGQQCRQGIGGDAWLGDDFQHLTATGTEAEQFAQALYRHRAVLTVDDANADLAFKTFCQLREDFRRARMQTVGVGQRNACARPIGWQLTAEHFQHCTATGGATQFMTATFDQQRAQAFEQGLMGLTEAGQTEQSVQRLTEIAQWFVRSDEGQPRTLDRLLAVQPPQAIAQRQRFDLLQHGGETVAHAVGVTQQTRTTPDQFFEIFGGHAQTDHLCIQRQLLRRALQQFEQGFGRAGATERLTQIGLAEGASQQLQQAQVFIGFGRDTDRQVDDLPVAPIHAFGKLHQAHAGGKHLIAGFWRTVGNGNTLTEKGRALGFACLQAGEVTLGDQAVGNQMPGQQLQRCGLIHSRLAHGYLLYSELEHAFLLFGACGHQVLF
ncbi:hypothetical protein D3C72_399740 [compost metagenome]